MYRPELIRIGEFIGESIMKRFIRSNKGMSLVELVIGMAILAGIGFAIASFIKTGTQSYASTSKDVNIQYEAQSVTNRINDILTAANGTVNFYVDGTLSDGEATPADDKNKELRIVTSDRESDGSDGFTVTYKEPVIQWRAADQELWYYEKEMTKSVEESTGDVVWTEGADLISPELMAQRVTLFTVEFPLDAEGKKQDIAKVTVNFADDRKNFESTANVSLRNAPEKNSGRIDFNSTGGEEGGEGGEGGDEVGTITKVKVSPAYAIVKPGGTVTLTASVRGTGVVNQGVTWSIYGGTFAEGTKINSAGRLTVAEDELADSMYVMATSVKDSTKYGTATVSIKQVTGVSVTKESGDTEQNMSLTLKAMVSGRNIALGAGNADQSVTWSVTEGGKYITQTGSSTFKISATAPVGTKVTITATSALDSTKSGSYTFNVKKTTATGGIADEEGDEDDPIGEGMFGFSSWPTVIPRGNSDEEGEFKVYKKNADNYYVDFDVEVTNSSGKVLDKTAYTSSKGSLTCTVKILKTLAYAQSATVKVTAYLIRNGRSKSAASSRLVRTATVEPVSLGLRVSKSTTYEKTIEKQYVYYSKGGNKVYYELRGITDSDVEWKIVNTKLIKITEDSEKDDGIKYKYFSIIAKGEDVSGETTAKAYVGSFYLGNIITVAVSSGNVKIHDTNYGDVWAYLPLPDEDAFNFSKENGTVTGGQWGKLATNKNYVKIRNLSSYYWNYWYYPKGTYVPWESESSSNNYARWRVIVSGSILNIDIESVKQVPSWLGKQITYPGNGTILYTYQKPDGTWTPWAVE